VHKNQTVTNASRPHETKKVVFRCPQTAPIVFPVLRSSVGRSSQTRGLAAADDLSPNILLQRGTRAIDCSADAFG